MSAHTGHTVIVLESVAKLIWCEDCGHAIGVDSGQVTSSEGVWT